MIETFSITFVLFFSDDTFAIFSGCGWEERDVELMEEDYSLDPNRHNTYSLLELGVIDELTHEEMLRSCRAEQKIIDEERERLQYEKLKLKYKE